MVTKLQRRLPRRDDDSGSLMFALLLIFLATALASLMTPVLLISMNGTRADQRRAASISAAQAGIDIVVGEIRAANDGNAPVNNLTAGVLSKLPCASTSAPLIGSVSAAGNSRYSVTVAYYSSDPRGQNSTWLSSNAILCVPNAGARSAPSYALIVSQGTDQATGAFNTLVTRTVQATYIFQSTNANIAGGLIHVYKAPSTKDLCIDAGSGSPSAGTTVTMQACTTGKAQQTWAYNQNLTISLVSSQTTSLPLGMCLDAGTPETDNLVVQVQPCSTVTLPQQQWSINDSANFQGTTNGSDLNGPCFNVQNPDVIGSQIILSSGNCGGSNTFGTGYDNVKNWQPAAAVGAGAAGASSGQLVNFNEFGRCLDVTEQNINYGGGYLIVWPCKQAPNPANVNWNQHWTLPATGVAGEITTNYQNAGTLYCLQSPLSTASGQYVFETQCPTSGATPTNLTWTVMGKTNDYATSYEIVDGTGNLCLQATDPTATTPDFYPNGNGISKTIVATCNGSTLQKWNAPANLLSSTPLKDIGEK